MKKNASFKFLVPVGLTLLFAVLAAAGISTGLEYRIMDELLGFRASPPEDPRIVLVDVDDTAITAIGTWPISRSITANGLMLLAEMGAKQATFDIEYTDKSPRGVNSEILEEEIPQYLDTEMGRLQANIKGLFEAVASRQISVKDAGDYVDDLIDVAEMTKSDIKDAIGRIALDNDSYLSEAARFFGDAYFTINMRKTEEDAVPAGLREKAIELHSLKNIEVEGTGIKPAVDIVPVIDPVIGTAKGIGFTNAEVDDDGIRRRIMLVQKYGDAWFGQLVLRPLLDLLGNPKVTVRPRSIQLSGAKMADGSIKDINIPVSSTGTVLLDWPHSLYNDSFRHVSFYHLYMHDRLFADLVHNVRIGESNNYFHAFMGETPLLELERQSAALKTAIMSGDEAQDRVADYAALRNRFLSELGGFLSTKPEDAILVDIEGVLADPALDTETRSQFELFKTEIPDFFAKTRDVYDNLLQIRSEKLGVLSGAFCIIGQTNTGSTDLGANPFVKEYPNIGTHASLVNMILNGQFISSLSFWWSILLALILSLGLSILTRTRQPFPSMVIGLVSSVGVIFLAAVFFALTGSYLPVIPLAGPILLSFITLTFIKFFVTEKERGFLRSAFSHYLSADVIKQIIANPDRLKLGGEQKFMTAMFTDIQGFSTISEKLTPVELVALLNRYLTGMSDQVLEMGGTIDKYEGDAIIAFFGAPIDLADHAKRALTAAVRMKRIEAELNAAFLEEGIAPSPLLTRFGINTGQMVVGNMGTEKKMDYTIIGDAVNLAARLEGVNKRYGTWMCVSEDTMKEAGPGFVFRRLDRIRVIGKAVPIRIFELIEEEGKLSETKLQALDLFEKALELFEARNWAAAGKTFADAVALVPDDGPSLRYIKTCKEYMETPPPESWDGVYKMDMK